VVWSLAVVDPCLTIELASRKLFSLNHTTTILSVVVNEQNESKLEIGEMN